MLARHYMHLTTLSGETVVCGTVLTKRTKSPVCILTWSDEMGTGYYGFSLALKPMNRIIQSLKNGYQWPHKIMTRDRQNGKSKTFKRLPSIMIPSSMKTMRRGRCYKTAPSLNNYKLIMCEKCC